jgi:hypothetical protein
MQNPTNNINTVIVVSTISNNKSQKEELNREISEKDLRNSYKEKIRGKSKSSMLVTYHE